MLAEEIGPILRSIRRTLAARQSFDPAASERVFRIAMADFWGFAVVDFLSHAAREAPGIGLSWTAMRETSLLALADEQLDLVVAPSALSCPDGLRSAPAGDLSWRCFMRQGHPAADLWGPAAWQRHGHVVVGIGDRLPSPVAAASGQSRLERRVVAQIPSFSAVAPLLARSDLIATLPALALGESARAHNLLALDPPFPIDPIPHSIYWSARLDGDPAIRWMLDELIPAVAMTPRKRRADLSVTQRAVASRAVADQSGSYPAFAK